MLHWVIASQLFYAGGRVRVGASVSVGNYFKTRLEIICLNYCIKGRSDMHILNTKSNTGSHYYTNTNT